MNLRRYSANYIVTGNGAVLKNGIVECDPHGVVTNIIDTRGDFKELSSTEAYNGVIVPGFINSHSHLELSYLKGKIDEKIGFPGFIDCIKNQYLLHYGSVEKEIKKWDRIMRENGIVAVGDISNTENSGIVKKNSSIYYHTFIECFGLIPEMAETIINKACQQSGYFNSLGLKSSVTPHAAYSVSEDLMEKIFENNIWDIVSYHHEESEWEMGFFNRENNNLINGINDRDNYDYSWQSKKSPFERIKKFIGNNTRILLVHNTLTSKETVEHIMNEYRNIFWVICPKSNLYITNKLPDINIFRNYTENICLGTDSLASNKTLSILEEMKTLQDNSDAGFMELLKYATINGAKALNIEDKYGSIDIGKKPGLNLIQNFNFNSFRLTPESKVKVLV